MEVGSYEGKSAQVTRVVHYCMLCRQEFHEGEPISKAMDVYLGRPPGLKALPGHAGSVTPLRLNPFVPVEPPLEP